MNLYHIWCDLVPGTRDLDFARAVEGWLGHLREQGAIEAFRITRRKLGLGPDGLGEWHIVVETRDLAQLDAAFVLAASRAGSTEVLHHCVNRLARNTRFALYRDFPDTVRVEGEEQF